jgi:hypothetical protein
MRVTREVETKVADNDWNVVDSNGDIFFCQEHKDGILCSTDELPRLVRLLTRLNDELNGPKEDRTNG